METDKDRYEQIIKKIELAEVYAHEVKFLLTKVDRTCEIGTIERTDREDTLQQRVHLLLKGIFVQLFTSMSLMINRRV